MSSVRALCITDSYINCSISVWYTPRIDKIYNDPLQRYRRAESHPLHQLRRVSHCSLSPSLCPWQPARESRNGLYIIRIGSSGSRALEPWFFFRSRGRTARKRWKSPLYSLRSRLRVIVLTLSRVPFREFGCVFRLHKDMVSVRQKEEKRKKSAPEV